VPLTAEQTIPVARSRGMCQAQVGASVDLTRAKVLIVDSALRNLGGHNYSYTRAVESELEARGHPVTVIANKGLPDDLAGAHGYEKALTFGAYDFALGQGRFRVLRYIGAQGLIHADELEAVSQRIGMDEYGLIFCHTVGEFELLAWSRLLSRRRFPGHLMIVQRNTPRYRACGRLKRLLHPYWRLRPDALNAIDRKMRGRFVLLTDSEPLTEDYRAVCRARVVTLPIPVPAAVTTARQQEREPESLLSRYRLERGNRLVLGYMGDARGSKGFLLLPDLIERILVEHGLDVRFVIQCPGSASDHDGGRQSPGVAELQNLARRVGDRLVLIPEKLGQDDYGDLLRFLDVILVPYLREGYIEPTSGIFAEALAAAKPVVVTRGTWMAGELGKSGSGVEFESNNVDDLTTGTLHLIDHYREFATKAAMLSEPWQRFHNAGNLVDILLRESGLAPTVSPPFA
jgi:glycosyltransferase involved in cell wall biosynthesis